MSSKKSLFDENEHYTSEGRNVEDEFTNALRGVMNKYKNQYKKRELLTLMQTAAFDVALVSLLESSTEST